VSRTDVAGNSHFSTNELRLLFAVFIRTSFSLVASSLKARKARRVLKALEATWTATASEAGGWLVCDFDRAQLRRSDYSSLVSTGAASCRTRLAELDAATLIWFSALSATCFTAFVVVSYAVFAVSMSVVMNVFQAVTAGWLPAGAFFARFSA
jgi:hypothetical protein